MWAAETQIGDWAIKAKSRTTAAKVTAAHPMKNHIKGIR